jgi:hypothetical protein
VVQGDGHGGSVGGVGEGRRRGGRPLHESGSNDVVVKSDGTSGRGKLEVDDGGGLDDEVRRDVLQGCGIKGYQSSSIKEARRN